MNLEGHYSASNYAPLPVTFTTAAGCYLYDADNKPYLDMLGAYSAASFGHCHPKLIEALHDQACTLDITSRAVGNDKLGAFLARACALTGMDKAIPMNTGAEAVETAIKIARKWGTARKGISPDTCEIITFAENFHGRTTTIISFSTVPGYKHMFGPHTPGFVTVPYMDIGALEAAFTNRTCAVLIEPIQGEAGIIVPPEGYLAQVAKLCRENHVLLICDEVQTGLGRTGKLLACQHDRVMPDILLLGKALGGGLVPVSLCLGSVEAMWPLKPGDHGSTFGGNPIAAAVGTAALNTLIEEGLIENSALMGDYFRKALWNADIGGIQQVRGRGLFIGVELHTDIFAEEVALDLLKEGLLTKATWHNTVRLAPPLTITRSQIDAAVAIFVKVLK